MLQRKLELDPPNEEHARRNIQSELMVLQTVPAIIRKLKAHNLSPSVINVLRRRFGDLWHLIVDESERSPTEEMNPILSTLLRAQQMPLPSIEEPSTVINNEVQHDNMKKVGQRNRLNRLPMRLNKLRLKNELTPAQRLLKVAAILIHESLSQKINERAQSTHRRSGGASRNTRRRHNRIHKKQLQQPSSKYLAAPEMNAARPEVILNGMRHKRSLKYSESSKNDDVAMKLLQSMIDPNEAKEDRDDEIDSDDDYNYNDDEVEKSETKNKQMNKNGKDRGEPTDQKKQTQQLKREQQAKQANFMKTEDYKDYAFDTTDTDQFDDGEDLLRSFYAQKRRSAYDDYDYGSFSDLMHLAAKHTLRAQREDKYLSRLHFDDYLNDEWNDDSGDDDYVA